MHFGCLTFILLLMSTGCGNTVAGHGDAVANRRSQVEYIHDFERLLGKKQSRNWINDCNDVAGKPYWNSFIRLLERYTLAMQFDVNADRWNNLVSPKEEPPFYLNEVIEVHVVKDLQ